MKKKGKKKSKSQNEVGKKTNFYFNKQTLLGVIGGSGFLLIIKGVGGLIESIFERPSAHWRTSITVGNLFVYLIIVLVAMIAINILTSIHLQKKRIYQIVGASVVAIFIAFVLTLTIPLFHIILLAVHPMILVLVGAVLLPASGKLSLRKDDED